MYRIDYSAPSIPQLTAYNKEVFIEISQKIHIQFL